ncbi:MAG: glycosyltransferase [bacterium]
MKIAYISPYVPQECGIATYSYYLAHAVKKIDSSADVTILSENESVFRQKKRYKVIPCWSRKQDYASQILQYTDDIDILHIQHEYKIYGFDDRLLSLLFRLGKNTRKIITFHCLIPAQFSKKGMINESYVARLSQFVDSIVVHSASQSLILNRIGVPLSKINIIPHGTLITNKSKNISRNKLGLPLNTKLLVCFGFIKKHKCIHIALKVLIKILKKRGDVRLFISGGLAPNASGSDIKYERSLQEKIKRMGLKKYVLYNRMFYPNEDLQYLLGAADIALFPYFEENRAVSGALHLALGAKKPVIASRLPKFEELTAICEELLVLPSNTDGMAKIALRLLEDPIFRNFVITRIDQFRRMTSWEETANIHMSLYRSLLKY